MNIGEYAVAAIQRAVGFDVMNGKDDKTLNPASSAAIAQAVQMLMNFCKAFIK